MACELKLNYSRCHCHLISLGLGLRGQLPCSGDEGVVIAFTLVYLALGVIGIAPKLA